MLSTLQSPPLGGTDTVLYRHPPDGSNAQESRLTTLLLLWILSTVFYYDRFLPGFRPDRILFCVVLFSFLKSWNQGAFKIGKWGLIETLMASFFTLCSLSLWMTGGNRSEASGANTEINEVLNITVFPFITYFITKNTPYSRSAVWASLGVISMMTLYLALTSWFERYGLHRLIWPRYITDRTIGTHPDRSRGPFLQAVFMGFNMTVGLLCLYLRFAGTTTFLKRVLLFLVSLLTLGGIYFTFTRGPWIALGVALLVTSWVPSPIRKLSRSINMLLLVLFLFSGASQFSLSGGNLFSRRQNTLEQRDLNYRIAFHMGMEHPFFGVGFSRMGMEFDKYFNRYYRGEDWHKWDGNHNEYLGLFAEVGVFAVLFFILILGLMIREAVYCIRSLPDAMSLEMGVAVCSLSSLLGFALIAYFNQIRAAPFHVCITFLLAGWVAAIRQRHEGITGA